MIYVEKLRCCSLLLSGSTVTKRGRERWEEGRKKTNKEEESARFRDCRILDNKIKKEYPFGGGFATAGLFAEARKWRKRYRSERDELVSRWLTTSGRDRWTTSWRVVRIVGGYGRLSSRRDEVYGNLLASLARRAVVFIYTVLSTLCLLPSPKTQTPRSVGSCCWLILGGGLLVPPTFTRDMLSTVHAVFY